MKLAYYPYNLKFRHPFTISEGTKTHQPTLIVELEHFSIKGYGEAPAITYYNITVGTADDISIVKALRANTDAALRVDANAGWDLETALKLIPQLKELGVEYVEQPLAKDNWEGMKILYKTSSLPLFADEACVFEQDVEKCKDHFHGINIKLTKCSGITPALRMIKKARELDLKIMLGCMNESTVGSAAMAHLLPFIDYVDMDGPLLLEEDVATGIEYDQGKIIYSNDPGLGINYCGLFKK